MSKSLRNTVSPVALAEALSPTVGADVLRYSLMRAISFGQDGDFSIQDLLARYTASSATRSATCSTACCPSPTWCPRRGQPGPLEEKLAAAHAQGAAAAAKAFDEISPTARSTRSGRCSPPANDYVDKAAPWAAKKNDPARLGTIVATLVELLEAVSLMIAPVMPTVADAMRSSSASGRPRESSTGINGPSALPSRAPGEKLQKGAPIFPRFEKEREAELVAQFTPPPAETSGPAAAEATPPTTVSTVAAPAADPASLKAPIAYDDFAKLDLRVGVVISAERVKKKDKLLDLRVDIGEAAPRRIVAGIAAAYTPEAMVGKRVVVLCNLAPRDFGKGLVSEGMLLASDDGKGLSMLTPDAEKAPGAKVS